MSMDLPCSSDTSLLAKPEFLTFTMHCLSAIELPVHVFGAWCILFKTPSKMSTAKWSLLNLHIWSSITDLTTSFLTTPFLILPSMGGFSLGLLGKLGVPASVLAYVNFTLEACVGASVIGLFESRYTSLLGGSFWKKYGRYGFNVFNYTLATTFFIPQFVWFVPDQQEALLEARRFLPCDMDHPETVFFIGGSILYFVSVIFFMVAHISASMLYFSISIQKYLGKLSVISKHTYHLQSRLQYAMILQIAIPTMVFVIPVMITNVVVSANYHNQGLNNIAVFLLCTHGLSSTVAMLLIHQPYRFAMISLIPVYGDYYAARKRSFGVNRKSTLIP